MTEEVMENVTHQEKVIKNVKCNMCGKDIEYLTEPEELIGVRADYCHIEKWWGDYISKKDFTYDEFDLCEDCYDKIVSQFKIPVDRREH